MIIYLSGPMTGLPLHNHPEFNKWAKLFRDRGHQVLNPAENDGGSIDKGWSFYMELDINSLLISEAIVLLPNWQYSKGARLEIAVAHAIGRSVYLLNDFINKDINAPKLKVEPMVSVSVQQ